MEYAGKKILVIGLGKSGLSVVRWLVGQGAVVIVSDHKAESGLDKEVVREIKETGIILEAGGHREETFLQADTILISPGVPLDMDPLKKAQAKGIPVIGEMELAVRMIDTPIVAVTGTNGKSTVTAFLGALLERAGLNVFVGGNIGTPLMEYVGGHRRADYVIAEVSSFQLDTMETLCPVVAILLNISPDHLDRYPHYEAYIESKKKIFRNQRQGHYAVLNDDDAELAGFQPDGGARVLRYGRERKEGRHAFIRKGKLEVSVSEGKGLQFDLDGYKLPGRHNVENLMACVLAGMALELSQAAIQDTINHFRGLSHRQEWVGGFGEVDFYDDSKATNVDAASRSILSFDRPIILIAGGRHKGGDYAPFVRAARGRVKMAILLGESRALLVEAFDGIIPYVMAESMEDAVLKAHTAAKRQDIILLAPACSSFDMFTDYAHRGRVFKESVMRLGHGRG